MKLSSGNFRLFTGCEGMKRISHRNGSGKNSSKSGTQGRGNKKIAGKPGMHLVVGRSRYQQIFRIRIVLTNIFLDGPGFARPQRVLLVLASQLPGWFRLDHRACIWWSSVAETTKSPGVETTKSPGAGTTKSPGTGTTNHLESRPPITWSRDQQIFRIRIVLTNVLPDGPGFARPRQGSPGLTVH